MFEWLYRNVYKYSPFTNYLAIEKKENKTILVCLDYFKNPN